jgi:hypothetical protein
MAKAFSWETAENDVRSVRPSTTRTPEYIERVRNLLQQNRQITIRMLSEDLNINKMACHKILFEDLGKRKLSTRLVQRSLPQGQKENYSTIWADLLEGRTKKKL